MKIMKKLLFTITMLVSAQLFAMEAPPAPPAKDGSTLQDLPTEVLMRITRQLAEDYNHTTVQNFTALASSSKTMRAVVYDPKNMRTVLRSIRPAHAVDLARKFENLTLFQNQKAKAFISGAKRSLVDGKVLRESVRTAELALVEEIIAAPNVDINWPRRIRGETSLIKACKLGDQETFDVLLRHGASLNNQDPSGNTALMSAITFGRTPMVTALINAGANIYIQNNASRTAMDIAAMRGYFHIVRLLDNATVGAEIFSATQNNNTQRVKALLKHKQRDVTWRDSHGNTALSIAANLQNRALVHAFLQAGANPNATNMQGAAALSWAVFPEDDSLESNAGIVSRLLLAGADPNQADIEFGETPLFWAAEKGNPVVVQMLLQAGANQSIRNSSGQTPRDIAIESHNEVIVQILDQAVADGFLAPEKEQVQSPSKKRRV